MYEKKAPIKMALENNDNLKKIWPHKHINKPKNIIEPNIKLEKCVPEKEESI